MPTASSDIPLWQRLLEPDTSSLLETLRAADDIDLQLISTLRRRWPADLIAVAIELTAARRKAARKFPDPQRLVADRSGVEQASSRCIARHKAARFKAVAAGRTVHDLCCGIGGDAMSLAEIAPVHAIDVDPLRVWMTGHNAQCETTVADVTTLDLNHELVHLDPARRIESASGSQRLWTLDDYRPGPPYIESLLARCPDVGIKLGPGVDLDALGRFGEAEIEMISEGGTLTQAMLWCGRLAHSPTGSPTIRTATRLPESVSFSGDPGQPLPLGPWDRFIFAPDPALERADLLGGFAVEHGLLTSHPRIGVLSGPVPIDTPWLRGFEVCADMPWREKNVAAWLRANDGGLITIKTRGKTVNPDVLQRRLRRDGGTPYTIFIFRFDEKIRATICRAL